MSQNVSSILVCIILKYNFKFDLNYRYDCFVNMRTVQSKVRSKLVLRKRKLGTTKQSFKVVYQPLTTITFVSHTINKFNNIHPNKFEKAQISVRWSVDFGSVPCRKSRVRIPASYDTFYHNRLLCSVSVRSLILY